MPSIDYSKWDTLDDDDDIVASSSAAPVRAPGPGVTLADRQSNHSQSMQLIAQWISEAYPRIPSENRTQLIKFITIQHRGIHRDNTPRHLEIVAFLEADEAAGPPESRPHDDLLQALLALGHMCAKRSGDDSDKVKKAQASRVLEVVQGALNTLWAARCEPAGGARAVFDRLLKEPEGDYAKRYRRFEFASDVVKTPPEDPRDRAPPEPSFMTKLGRSVFLQLGIGLLATAIMAIMFAGLMFFDPEGTLLNPIARALLKGEPLADVPGGLSPPAETTSEWQSVEWSQSDAAAP